ALSNRALVEIAGETAPVVGRVSMDSITVDVTHIEESRIAAVNHATILGSRYDLASMARDAGTIGYEILTQLGRRPARRHLGG
ncbi:MAG: alanine racemase C-terminal domain-containing protein, partial [Pseudomonadota bacterium]|nr:alanine racemase C-terminal domain-containing protein [Pseudomonadota bacterium]